MQQADFGALTACPPDLTPSLLSLGTDIALLIDEAGDGTPFPDRLSALLLSGDKPKVYGFAPRRPGRHDALAAVISR
jgi:hypothetical protein